MSPARGVKSPDFATQEHKYERTGYCENQNKAKFWTKIKGCFCPFRTKAYLSWQEDSRVSHPHRLSENRHPQKCFSWLVGHSFFIFIFVCVGIWVKIWKPGIFTLRSKFPVSLESYRAGISWNWVGASLWDNLLVPSSSHCAPPINFITSQPQPYIGLTLHWESSIWVSLTWGQFSLWPTYLACQNGSVTSYDFF